VQATNPLTAHDIRWLVQALGATTTGGLLDNIADRINVDALSPEKIGELAAILVDHAPAHVAMFEALNADGSIRDEDAYQRMLDLAGQETGR
jgi:hypothetical protein